MNCQMLSEQDKELIVAATRAIRERYRDDWQEVGAAMRTRDGRVVTGVNIDAYIGRIAVCAEAIAMRDKAMVARSPGVGPKVAERIVTELKDKAPKYAELDPAVVRLAGAVDERRAPQPIADAVSALVNLGYGQPQAAAAIAAASREAGEGAETARLIRLGLRELAK